jgi:hypothetical protein
VCVVSPPKVCRGGIEELPPSVGLECYRTHFAAPKKSKVMWTLAGAGALQSQKPSSPGHRAYFKFLPSLATVDACTQDVREAQANLCAKSVEAKQQVVDLRGDFGRVGSPRAQRGLPECESTRYVVCSSLISEIESKNLLTFEFDFCFTRVLLTVLRATKFLCRFTEIVRR